ncbi:uncharacterized protein LAESUDRAFT_750831 [Laetiporus sulphureus 93-53]|uniref:Uncharacterized protein n=1 Tax=Laetiporus sulphureus 93-53 TaxID=1314785 RepID=A0A165DH88_9APHY|nr:uncharacterized protein LAESUDRAFT_750831 [Laetiporus sulphureus 93-53]KZT04873.1 hypothetical protein LAESUDRAFT_750831 [Laetiporus sulphureus 93-53]
MTTTKTMTKTQSITVTSSVIVNSNHSTQIAGAVLGVLVGVLVLTMTALMIYRHCRGRQVPSYNRTSSQEPNADDPLSLHNAPRIVFHPKGQSIPWIQDGNSLLAWRNAHASRPDNSSAFSLSSVDDPTASEDEEGWEKRRSVHTRTRQQAEAPATNLHVLPQHVVVQALSEAASLEPPEHAQVRLQVDSGYRFRYESVPQPTTALLDVPPAYTAE